MDNLNYTKRKLTLLFTLIVFFIILILWLIFFSAKYYTELRQDKIDFSNSISFIWKKINVLDNIINNFNIKIDIFNNIKDWIVRDIREKKSSSSYIIINRNNNSIVSSNVKNNIEKLYKYILDETEYNNFETYWFLLSKYHFQEKLVNYDIIFIKKLNYSYDNYLRDLMSYLIVVLLCSMWVYYIWYRFIWEALKPVEDNMRDMKYFVHNAWHELKTPISVIDSNIQLLDDIKSYDNSLTKEIREEIKRMNILMSWLIELTNINQDKKLILINLKEELEKIISWFRNMISKKRIVIQLDVLDKIHIKSNKDYLYIFLSNIIWNSIKYNNFWWKIDIYYKKWELIIKDTWIWIQENDLEMIFDRFYKADKSRNSEWFWIGLSLVKKIAKIYKWKIRVVSEKTKWTTFMIKFKNKKNKII